MLIKTTKKVLFMIKFIIGNMLLLSAVVLLISSMQDTFNLESEILVLIHNNLSGIQIVYMLWLSSLVLPLIAKAHEETNTVVKK